MRVWLVTLTVASSLGSPSQAAPFSSLVGSTASGRSCASVFSPNPVRTNWHLEFNDDRAPDLIAKIPRIQTEWPQSWVQIGPRYAELRIPKARWSEVYKLSFNEVTKAFTETTTFLVDVYPGGRYSKTYERQPFIAEAGVRRGDNGEEFYVLRFNRDLALWYRHMGSAEPSIAGMYIRGGLFKSKEWRPE